MTTSHDYPDKDRPTEAWCDTRRLHVVLADGRKIAVPLWWCPRLLGASLAQRNTVQLILDGVHWPEIDEDISVAALLGGRKAPGAAEPCWLPNGPAYRSPTIVRASATDAA
jgi:hypothetical protein